MLSFGNCLSLREEYGYYLSTSVHLEQISSSLAVVSCTYTFLHAGDLIVIENIAYYTMYGVDTIVSNVPSVLHAIVCHQLPRIYS